MLCHLVCTDRRYARMNCFNIRELQSILKRKFFTDLINTHDHKGLLETSMIGLRYKTHNNFNLNSDILSFYNFGLSTSNLNKVITFTDASNSLNFSSLRSYDYFFINFFELKYTTTFMSSVNLCVSTVCEYIYLALSFTFPVSLYFHLNTLFTTLVSNINFIFDSNYIQFINFNTYNAFQSKTAYVLQDINEDTNFAKNMFLESSSSSRYNRFSNILVNYDYKTGHYIGNWEQQYPFLYTSFIEVARGIRKPSWFLSEKYVELLKNNYSKFFINFTGKGNLKMSNVEDWYNSHIVPVDNFYNFYFFLKKDIKDSNMSGVR